MESFTNQLKSNWLILAFIVSMILWYGNVNARLSSVEAKQVEYEELSDVIGDLKLDVGVIKSTVIDIKERINK